MATDFVLGKYHILEPIGHGGFATVYKAEDLSLERTVALKVLDPLLTRDPNLISRFQQEAKVTAKLFHPNIAALFEVGAVDGRYFLAMQYIAGRNLRDLLQTQNLLPLDQIATIVQQIGAALDYAHAQGIVHRDVKPSNIIVDDAGHATLTDFGIVKVFESTTLQTTSGAIFGTPAYSSPEQVESKPLDGRSDLYSLGIVAYELCTGKVPFAADTIPSLYYKIVHEAPLPPSQANPRATGLIGDVLLKATAKQPDQRYGTGQAFAAEFTTAVEQVKGEQLDSLHQQAVAFFNQQDFDSAETILRQVLAIKPDQTPSQELLDTIGLKREVKQRYDQVVEIVRGVQKEITDLQQIDPNLEDPAGILGLVGMQAKRRKSPPRTEPKPKTEGRRFWQRRKPAKAPAPENTPKKTRRFRLWPRRTRQVPPVIKEPADVSSTDTTSDALEENPKAQSNKKPLTWRRVFKPSAIVGCVLTGIGLLANASPLQILGIASGCVALLSLVPPTWRLIQRFFRWIGRKLKRHGSTPIKAAAKKQP